MTTRAKQLLELRRQAQESHGYAPSSRWYTYLSNAINYLELAETAPAGIDQFRHAWSAIYNLAMMRHQPGEPENRTLSTWIGEMKSNPLIQSAARSFPTKLLETLKAAEQDLFWDAEKKKWRIEGRTAVENWLKKRNQNQELSGEQACSSALLIGRDLRNAISHPTMNPNKAKVKTALALAGEAFLRLAEVAIQTTIEHPQPGTTGRATAYRFFLYPYLRNSDGFLSDYYLERLLPDQEFGAFPENTSQEQLRSVQKELQARRETLVRATDVATTIERWCRAVLFPALGMQPQPGPRIVAEQAVFEPTFALARPGEAIQPEYQGKAASQDIAALIWVLPWRENLDRKADGAGLEGLSAMEAAQQALVQADVAWGVVTNGRMLRLLHKASAHKPRSFLEGDLETIAAQWTRAEAQLAFRSMLALFSQSSFVERDAQDRSRLERILAESERHGKEIGDELKQNVFKALEELGDGFLYLMRQNPEPVRQWQQRTGNGMAVEQYLESDDLLRAIYEESLALLYRLLFLFYAESRDLLPMHDELYRETYSLEALRDDIISVHDDPDPRRFFSQGATDLDSRLRELFRLIDNGFGNLIPAYNGGLFDPEQHPFLEHFKVGDYYLARAIDLLSRTRPQSVRVRGEGRKKVTYRDLDVRHLGEIYEGLLEYSAHIAREEQVIFERRKNNQKYEEYVAASALSAAERKQLEDYRRAREENPDFPAPPRGCSVTGVKEPGQYFLVYGGKESQRKSSGSYYTPDYIVQYIVENTLGPLVRGENREGDKQNVPLTADEILDLKVLDPAMGSGHFLVAATEYLARAYGQALIREGRISDGALNDVEFIRSKRIIAERCIYGVDINPMAVELAKLSLWLFTMDPQRPLSFLDHHLKCGNSLIGAWIKDLGALPGVKQPSNQLNLFEHRFLERIPVMVSNVLGITHRETLSREDIAAKRALDQAIEELKRPFRNIADAWVATYFGEQVRDYEAWLTKPELARDYRSPAAAQHRFFHWELEFPEVWFDKNGQRKANSGFSAIIGNPPWGGIYKSAVTEWLSISFANFHQRTPEASNYFMALASLRLVVDQGIIGHILPSVLFFQNEFNRGREFLLREMTVKSFLHLGDGVFEGVSSPCGLLVVKKGNNSNNLCSADLRRFPRDDLPKLINSKSIVFADIPVNDVLLIKDTPFVCDSEELKFALSLQNKGIKIADLAEDIASGISTGGDDAFRIPKHTSNALFGANPVLKPVIKGSDISEFYVPRDSGYVIIYSTKDNDVSRYPEIINYLDQYRTKLANKRETLQGKLPWYCLHWPRYTELFDAPKVVLRQTADTLIAAVDYFGYYTLNSIIVIKPHIHYRSFDDCRFLAGVLNSTPIRRLYKFITQEEERVFPEVKPANLRKLIIPILSNEDFTKIARAVAKIEEIQAKRASILLQRGIKTEEIHRELVSCSSYQDSMLSHLTDEFNDLKNQIDRIVALGLGC